MWMSIEAILVQLTLFHAFVTHTSTKHILYKYELLTFKKNQDLNLQGVCNIMNMSVVSTND